VRRALRIICGAIFVGLALLPVSAQEQTVAERVVGCTAIEKGADRLVCYDEIALPLLGLREDGEEDSLASFVGEGHWDSDTLSVDKPFRIAWQSEATSLTIELLRSGSLLAIIGPQIGASAGRTDEVYDLGEYSVRVRASDGNWRVQLVAE
jgi:hypothetical protein